MRVFPRRITHDMNQYNIIYWDKTDVTALYCNYKQVSFVACKIQANPKKGQLLIHRAVPVDMAINWINQRIDYIPIRIKNRMVRGGLLNACNENHD